MGVDAGIVHEDVDPAFGRQHSFATALANVALVRDVGGMGGDDEPLAGESLRRGR